MSILLDIHPWVERLGDLGVLLFLVVLFQMMKLGRLRTDGGDWQTQLFPGGEYSVSVEEQKRTLRWLATASLVAMFASMIGSQGIYIILLISGHSPPQAPWGLQPLSFFSTTGAVFGIFAVILNVLVRERERYDPLEKPESFVPPASELTRRGRLYRWGVLINLGVCVGLLATGIVLQLTG